MSESDLYFKQRLKAVDVDLDRDLIGVAHPKGGTTDSLAMSLRELSAALGGGGATAPFVIKGPTVWNGGLAKAGVFLAIQNPDGSAISELRSVGTDGSFGFGHNTLAECNTWGNCAFGDTSLQLLVGGTSNTAFGQYCMQSLVGGEGNTALGEGALTACGPNVSRNIGIGRQAGHHVPTDDNIAIGWKSLRDSGGANIAIGTVVGYSMTTGARNSIVGQGAADVMTTGNDNCGLGNGVFYQTLTSGSRNIGVGAGSGPATGALDGTICIGHGVQADVANIAVIGPVAVTDVYFGSKAAPNAKIHAKQIRITSLPVAVTGLPSGTLWNNGGIVNVAP